MVRVELNVTVCVSWLLMNFSHELTLDITCKPNIHEGQCSILLLLHCELDARVLRVQMLKKRLATILLDYRDDVVYKSLPDTG